MQFNRLPPFLVVLSFSCSLALALSGVRADDAGSEREATQLQADAEGALKSGRSDEAVALLERAAQLFEANQGATGPGTLAALNKLALAQNRREGVGQNDAEIVDSVPGTAQMRGKQHDQTLKKVDHLLGAPAGSRNRKSLDESRS